MHSAVYIIISQFTITEYKHNYMLSFLHPIQTTSSESSLHRKEC